MDHFPDGRARREGLQKVVESMACRVDAGEAELEGLVALQRQKERLTAAGRAVLGAHCAESWGPRRASAPAVTGVGIECCAAGGWQLRAELSGAAEAVLAGSVRLLAFSRGGRVTLAQQRCTRGAAGALALRASLGVDWDPPAGGGAAPQELELEVAVLLRQGGGAGAAPAAVWPAGRVTLRRRDWLLGAAAAAAGSSSSGASQPAGQGGEQWPEVSLAVQSSDTTAEPLLSRLGAVLRGDLGCQPGASGAPDRYVCPGAEVRLDGHGPTLAEVHIRGGSTAVLRTLRRQLEASLGASCTGAAAADDGGAAPEAAQVSRSALSVEHATAAARAADALVAGADAAIAWLEGRLVEHEAAAGHFRKRKLPGVDPGEAAARQAAALAAGAEACARVAALSS